MDFTLFIKSFARLGSTGFQVSPSTFKDEPTILSAQAYDATKMLIKTIHSGAKNRIQVKKRLLQIRGFQGVSGKTTILSTGEAEKKLFAMKILKKKIVEAN